MLVLVQLVLKFKFLGFQGGTRQQIQLIQITLVRNAGNGATGANDSKFLGFCKLVKEATSVFIKFLL
jgi:hypothetical protein